MFSFFNLRKYYHLRYTVSYVVGDGTFKHFLVERIPEGYQFLGTNQVVHDQLFDLISYHEVSQNLCSLSRQLLP